MLRSRLAGGQLCAAAAAGCLTIPHETAADDQARLAQKLAAMYYTCTKHTNSTNCDADSANNCQWVDISDIGMCISNPNDMWEDLLVCPGSVVAQAMKCRADSQEACASVMGCKWIDVLNASISVSTSKALTLSAGDFNFTVPTGMCWPEGVPTSEYNATVSAGDSIEASATVTYPTSLYGDCAGVNVLKSFTAACDSTLNATSCKAKDICQWTGSDIIGRCGFAPTGRAELLFTTTGSAAFNEATAKAFTDCRAAENATQCAAVGTKQIEESKVTEALAFVQASAKSAAAGVRPLLHVLLGAVSVAALLVLGF
ncbi:hypothetical protein OEZ86_003508 [Tetradesmus obliquus]|nr:hypothetical protein OEZ86_003508 [Tetradesmus obliquus]